MFHRPSPRIKYPPFTKGDRSFLVSCGTTNYYVPTKDPIYKYDDYKRLLVKNNMEMGIPYTDPGLPIVENREPVFIYDTYKHTDPNRVLPVPVAPDTP